MVEKKVELDLEGITPWEDIASQLHPMMPKREYEALRKKYFYDNIAPRAAKAGFDPHRTYENFAKATDRPELLSGADKLMLPVAIGAVSAAREMIAPVSSLAQMVGGKEAGPGYENFSKLLSGMQEIAARDEVWGTNASAVAGQFVGMGVPLVLGWGAAGPLASSLAGRAALNAQRASQLARAVRGGVSFGAYEGLREQDADKRVIRGLEGLAFGGTVAFGAAIGGLGSGVLGAVVSPEGERAQNFLMYSAFGAAFGKWEKFLAKKDVSAIEAKLLRGEKPANAFEEVIDRAMAEQMKKSAEVAKASGMELRVSMTPADKAEVHFTRVNEAGASDTRIVSIKHDDGMESVVKLLDQGWGIDEALIGQDYLQRYQILKQRLRAQVEGEVTETVLTVQDSALELAQAMKAKGVPAQAIGPNHVAVASPIPQMQFKSAPSSSIVNARVRELKRAGTEIPTEMEAEIQGAVTSLWSGEAFSAERVKSATGLLRKYEMNNFIPEESKLQRSIAAWERSKAPIAALDKADETRVIQEQVDGAIKPKANLLTDPSQDQVANTFYRATEPTGGVRQTGPDLFRGYDTAELERAMQAVWKFSPADEEFRARAYLKLKEALPEILPENWTVLNPEIKSGLTIADDVLAKARAERGMPTVVEVTAPDRKVLKELGATDADIDQAAKASKSLDDMVPPSEMEDLAEVMAHEVARPGMTAAERQLRGAKKARDPRTAPEDYSADEMAKMADDWAVGKGVPDGPPVGEPRMPKPTADQMKPRKGRVTKEDVRVQKLEGDLDKLKVEVDGIRTNPRIAPTIKSSLLLKADNKMRKLEKELYEARELAKARKGTREAALEGKWTESRTAGARPPVEDISLYGLRERPNYFVAHMSPDHPLAGRASGATFSSVGQYYLESYQPRMSSLARQVWGSEKPLVLLPKQGYSEKTVFHEGLHATIQRMNQGGQKWLYAEGPLAASAADRSTAMGIARGLRAELSTAYGRTSPYLLLEEAFVQAATALRHNDYTKLLTLARWDKSIEDVLGMVYNTSRNLYAKSFTMAESSIKRTAQRRFADLERRASKFPTHEANKVQFNGYTFFDADKGKWVVRDMGAGTHSEFSSAGEMWTKFMQDSLDDVVPNYTTSFENFGFRGPFAPLEKAIASTPLDPNWKGANWGWQAFRGWTRPFFPWVATIDEKLNKYFAIKGQHFPVLDRVKALDREYRAGMMKLATYQEELLQAFKKIDSKKMEDVFEWLSYPVEEMKYVPGMKYVPKGTRDKATNALKMGEKEIEAALKYEQWEARFAEEFGVNGKYYRQHIYPQLRDNNFNPNTVKQWPTVYKEQAADLWENAIRGDQILDPKANRHILRFANFLMEQGLQKKFTGEPLKQLQKLLNTTASDGKYLLPAPLRAPIQNYHNYMKGYPDVTQRMLNQGVETFTSALNRQIASLNSHLPEGMKFSPITSPPKEIINRLLIASYASGLGARPGANLRDLAQVFITAMPVIGPAKFSKALGKLFSDRAKTFDRAREAGALLSRLNIGELWGDVIQELPRGGTGLLDRMTRFSQMLLQPQRWTDNIGRAIVFTAEKDAALAAISKYRASSRMAGMLEDAQKRAQSTVLSTAERVEAEQAVKQLEKAYKQTQYTADDLMHDTTLWWNDRPVRTRLVELAGKEFVVPVETVPSRLKRTTVPDGKGGWIEKSEVIPPEIRAKVKEQGVNYDGIIATTESEYVSKLAERFGLEAVDLTMWPYRKGGQPALLRTGLGRIMGQYGMYPMNYFDFLRRGSSKLAENPRTRNKALATAAYWMGVNYAAVEAMEGLGAEATQWFGTSPAAYAGGPHMEFVLDLMRSWENSEAGRDARARVMSHPINFIPLGAAARNAILAGSQEGAGDGLLSPGMARVLGFRPLQKDEIQEFEERVREELGLVRPRRRM